MKGKSTSSEIISHRCLGFGHQENSLLAMRTALVSNVDGVEIDVRLTKDHKWVVIHNPFLKSEERKVLRVHERTYMQLRTEVTPLDVMLALFAANGSGKSLMIDVKDVGEERKLVRAIQQYDLQSQVVVIAWEPEVLRRVHAIDSEIKIGFSYVPIHSTLTYVHGTIKPPSRHGVVMQFNAQQSFDAKFKEGKTPQHFLATLPLPELNLHSIQVPAVLCSDKLVKLAHDKGIKVYPFSVQSRIGHALLRRRGIDGILTNYPLRFL